MSLLLADSGVCITEKASYRLAFILCPQVMSKLLADLAVTVGAGC